MAEINIKSWKEFKNRNKDIEAKLDEGANDIIGISASIEHTASMIKTINEKAFGNLKTVINKGDLEIDGGVIDAATQNSSDLMTLFHLKSCKIVGTIYVAEYMIDLYNKGKYNQEDANTLFDEILKATNSSGLFWILSYGAQDTCPGLSTLTGFIAKRLDSYAGGAYGTADICRNFSKYLISKIPGVSKNWKNMGSMSVGAMGAYIFTYYKDRFSDKGEWTDIDNKRANLHGGKNAINFLAWDGIMFISEESLGGIVTAIGVTYIADKVETRFIDEITGDVVVDKIKSKNTFTGETQEYIIHKNGGKGGNQTYDVYKEEYLKLNKHYEIDGKEYSTMNYKKEIYEDWTKTGVIDDEKGLSKKYYKQEMDKSLEKLKNAKTLKESKKIIKDNIYGGIAEDGTTSPEISMTAAELEEKGFDFEEYYAYHNPELSKGTVEGFNKID